MVVLLLEFPLIFITPSFGSYIYKGVFICWSMSVLLTSSNNYISVAVNNTLFEFKYRLTQFSIDCDPFQDRSESSESK